MQTIQESVAAITEQNADLHCRLDDLEDRSRRENLNFHGVSDETESWEETEKKILDIINQNMDFRLPCEAVEHAHRLGGPYQEQKWRPIIVKFLSFKTKDKVFAQRSNLKDCDITVSQDFSPATRLARKKLVEFGKALPNLPAFKLRHDKLVVNKKTFAYDRSVDTVHEIAPRGPDSGKKRYQGPASNTRARSSRPPLSSSTSSSAT